MLTNYLGCSAEVSQHYGDILVDVLTERLRQGIIHPKQTCRYQTVGRAYLVIAEEFGEIAKAIMEETPVEVYDEAIQTIACLVAMLEGMIERGEVVKDEGNQS